MRFRFRNCEIDTASHQLFVGDEATEVEPQVFDLLSFLAGKPGELVSHEELIDAVWHGRIVSDSAISSRISAARAAIGDSGAEQRIIKTVARRGFRFVANVEVLDAPQTESGSKRTAIKSANQRIRYCRSADGTSIAFADSGNGYPLVRAGHWLTHLEHDWHSPVWRPILDEFGLNFHVTRYDQRGNGLSDRDVDDYSLEAFVADLEAVADTAGLDRFALYGASQGAPIAVAYAARHPERVSHLILYGGYQRGRQLRKDVDEREQGQALLKLIRHGWGKPGSPFIQAFSSIFIPGGTPEQIASLTELQRISASPENAAKLRDAVDRFDVSGFLELVESPTLVIHAQGDGVQPLNQGRELAAGIKNAEFVLLESNNHINLQHEPAWTIFFDEIRRFVLTKTG